MEEKDNKEYICEICKNPIDIEIQPFVQIGVNEPKYIHMSCYNLRGRSRCNCSSGCTVG